MRVGTFVRMCAVVAVLVAGIVIVSQSHPRQGSVMAGIQSVIAPVVRAQGLPGGLQNCNDIFDEFSELEFEGWYISVTSEQDQGPYIYGYDLVTYYGFIAQPNGTGAAPFSITCLNPW